MTPHRFSRPLRAATFTAALAMLVSGCMSLDPVSETTRYYTLASTASGGAPAAVPATGAPRIGVRVAYLAAHLRGPAMARRVADHEVRYADSHRWADRLDDGIARELASGLQRRVGSRLAVSTVPGVRSIAPQILVEIDVVAFEGRLGAEPAALFVADWRVTSGPTREVFSSGRFRAEKPGWDAADHGQLAALLGAAVDELAEAIAPQVAASIGR